MNTIPQLKLEVSSLNIKLKTIQLIFPSHSSLPNIWTEQESLQNSQAFGLLASYKENLIHIGGRDPFSGIALPVETKAAGQPSGAWTILTSLTGDISQYLSGCRRIHQERIFTSVLHSYWSRNGEA